MKQHLYTKWLIAVTLIAISFSSFSQDKYISAPYHSQYGTYIYGKIIAVEGDSIHILYYTDAKYNALSRTTHIMVYNINTGGLVRDINLKEVLENKLSPIYGVNFINGEYHVYGDKGLFGKVKTIVSATGERIETKKKRNTYERRITSADGSFEAEIESDDPALYATVYNLKDKTVKEKIIKPERLSLIYDHPISTLLENDGTLNVTYIENDKKISHLISIPFEEGKEQYKKIDKPITLLECIDGTTVSLWAEPQKLHISLFSSENQTFEEETAIDIKPLIEKYKEIKKKKISPEETTIKLISQIVMLENGDISLTIQIGDGNNDDEVFLVSIKDKNEIKWIHESSGDFKDASTNYLRNNAYYNIGVLTSKSGDLLTFYDCDNRAFDPNTPPKKTLGNSESELSVCVKIHKADGKIVTERITRDNTTVSNIFKKGNIYYILVYSPGTKNYNWLKWVHN
jgi:hypothetical protein